MKKIIVLLSLVFMLVSCGKTAEVKDDSQISVVTSIVPIAAITNTIWGDLVSVVNLVSPGVSPHDFNPSPKDLIDVEKSDVIFYTGLEHIDGFFDSAVANKNAIVLSQGIELIKLDNPHLHDHSEHEWETHEEHEAHWAHEDEDHEDEHEWETDEEHAAHAEHEDEDHKNEDHENEHEWETHEEHAAHAEDDKELNHDKDPHFWTSSIGAMKIAQKVRDELSAISPENKDLFYANYTKFEQELKMIDDNFAVEIKGRAANNFIIFHDAYGYLFAHLGIDKSRALLFQKNITGSQNPAELQEFIDAIEDKKISIFFREPQFRKSQLDNLTKQYNLTGMILDPLGANQESGGYLENYKNNLEALKATYK